MDIKIIDLPITTIITVFVSAITSAITTRQELKKVPYDIKKVYADNLQKQRLIIYPKYYVMLSDLIKRIDRRLIDLPFLEKWLDAYLVLDSSNSLILSGKAANINYSFYVNLEEFIYNEKRKQSYNKEEFYYRLQNCNAHYVETILKKDLGIFDVEFDPKNVKKVKTYNDIDILSDS